MISFKNVGHFFATVFQKVKADLPKVEAGVQQVAATKTVVEGATQLIAPGAVPIEDAAYAVLCAVGAALTAGGSATEAKLADAGLDAAAIEKAKAALATIPQFVALAKAGF